VCLPRRAYTADVVGAVLLDVERGRDVAGAAAAQLVPVSTARRWVRAVVGSADAVTAAAVRVAWAAGDATGCQPLFGPGRAVGVLTGVLNALGAAAAVWTAGRAIPRTGVLARSGAVTGIDYLALVHQEYQQGLLRDLGVADPGDALGATVTGWPLVNALTGGRLLTTPG
jgi:hypothetical protein